MDRKGLSVTVLLLAAAAASAGAQERYRHGRVRHADPGVTLQRAAETAAEEAVPNMPFLPGDRVWTDRLGRGEFQFADGSYLRLDARSKLDYLAHDDSGREDRVVLELWSGRLMLRVPGRGDVVFVVETPAGARVVVDRAGVYRIDAERSEIRLAVYEGEASLEGDSRVRVRDGEEAFARGTEVFERRRFDRLAEDDFSRWDEARQAEVAWAGDVPEYVPDEVAPYYGELAGHGSWHFDVSLGHVWRPRVGLGWLPYSNGYWAWTAYGWTWVPYEPWGWATFHWGRWDYRPGWGWYWLPSRGWGPGWVSWSVGRDHVGWRPLGHRDGLVHVGQGSRDRGRAVPRSGGPRAGADADEALMVARRVDLGQRDLGRRRVSPGTVGLEELRAVARETAHLTREGTVAEGPVARPRPVRTQPTPGDTVPELRTDPRTVVPAPVARTRYESERERQRERELPSAAERLGSRRSPERRYESSPAPREEPGTVSAPIPPAGQGERERAVVREEDRGRVRRADPDRELLRPLFESLRARRGESDRGEADRNEDRAGRSRPRGSGGPPPDSGAARPEGRPPRVSSPPPPPPPSPQGDQGGRAQRRKPRGGSDDR
jgi:hypothetical protein